MSHRFLMLCVVLLACTTTTESLQPLLARAQVPGGFSAIDVADKDVVKVAEFLVREKNARFIKVLKAESQVVAGRNFRLVVDVTTKDEVRKAEAVVFQGLKGSLSLTNWTWIGKARPAVSPVIPGGIEKAQLVITNKLAVPVERFWLSKGEEVSFGTIKAGDTVTQDTFAGHEWIFRDARNRTIVKRFTSTGGRATLVLEQGSGTPGGASPIDVRDPQVVKAADFAVRTKNETLIRIVKAESQVVAGRNYLLTLEIKAKGGSRQAQATVFAKLDGTFQLTSWTLTGGGAQPAPTDKAQLVITNNTKKAVLMFWVDMGKEVSFGRINPGERITQDTFAGHEWIFRDAGTKLVLRRVKSMGGRSQVVLD